MDHSIEDFTNPGRGADRSHLFGYVNAAVISRSAVVALVLGTVLTVINQRQAVFDAAAFEFLPTLLVYLTPFIVVTLSQATAARAAAKDGASEIAASARAEPILAVLVSHGIPARAVVIGTVIGTINALIVLAAAGGRIDVLPVVPLVQAYTLPVLFGLLSQAITYKREIGGSNG